MSFLNLNNYFIFLYDINNNIRSILYLDVGSRHAWNFNGGQRNFYFEDGICISILFFLHKQFLSFFIITINICIMESVASRSV